MNFSGRCLRKLSLQTFFSPSIFNVGNSIALPHEPLNKEEQSHQHDHALHGIQPQLEVGAPDDKYEKEADAVADRVMLMPDHQPEVQLIPQATNEATAPVQMQPATPALQLMPTTVFTPDVQMEQEETEEELVQMKPERVQLKSGDGEEVKPVSFGTTPPDLQRKCSKCKQEEGKIQPKHLPAVTSKSLIQRKCNACEEKEKLQPKPAIQKASNGKQYAGDSIQQSLQQSKGGGQPLPEATNKEMSSKIGADFSDVRIHTNSTAVQMNRDLGAKAFTHGGDLYFNQGQYNPESSAGKHLLAHELTHVTQQVPNVIQRNGPEEEEGDPDCATGHAEGQGGLGEDAETGEKLYIVWGTWKKSDNADSFLRRNFKKWIYWRFGRSISASLHKKIFDDLMAHTWTQTKADADIIPGCQYYAHFERALHNKYSKWVRGEKKAAEADEAKKKEAADEEAEEGASGGGEEIVMDEETVDGDASGGGNDEETVDGGGGSEEEEVDPEGSEVVEDESTTTDDVDDSADDPAPDQQGGLPADAEHPPQEQGLKFSDQATPDQIKKVVELLTELYGEAKEGDTPATGYLTMNEIEALLALDKHPDRDAIMALMKGGSGKKSDKPVDWAERVETATAAYDMQQHADLLDIDLGEPEEGRGPIFKRPVRGKIQETSGNEMVIGKEAKFTFQLHDHRDAFAVSHVSIRWVAMYYKGGVRSKSNLEVIETETTNYIDSSEQGFLNDRIFNFKFDETGDYEIHAFVNHAFFYPAHFMEPISVRKDTEVLADMQKEAEKDFGTTDPGSREEFSFEDADADPGWWLLASPVGALTAYIMSETYEYDKGFRSEGDLKEDIFNGKGNFVSSAKRLDEQIASIQKLIDEYKDKPDQKDLLDWAKERKSRLESTKDELEALQDSDTNYPVACQALYVTRTAGVRNGQLKASCWFTYSDGEFEAHLFDHSELLGAKNMHFTGEDSDYERAMEELFFNMSSSYPNGVMSFAFQKFELKNDTPTPTKRFVRFERKTDTLLGDIKNVVFSQPVSLVVNIGAAVLTVFPATAPIGIGISLIYNGAETALNFYDASKSGTVQASNYVDIGLVAVELIPVLGKATKLVSAGSKAHYIITGIETVAGVGGAAYMMTAEGYKQITELRDGKISDLARMQEEFNTLLEEGAPASVIQQHTEKMDKLKKDIRSTAADVFTEMATTQGLTIVSQKTASKLASDYAARPKGDADAGGTPDDASAKDVDESALTSRDADAATQGKNHSDSNSEELSKGLSEDLRDKVSIQYKPDDDSATVEVHYEYDSNGAITEIYIKAGKGAKASHIKAHETTIRRLQTYRGLTGRIKVGLRRFENMVATYTGLFNKKPEMYSKAWEAELEVRKMNEIIAKQKALLDAAGNNLSAVDKDQLKATIDDLEKQKAKFEGILETLDPEKGVGFIAAEDNTGKNKGTGNDKDTPVDPTNKDRDGPNPEDKKEGDPEPEVQDNPDGDAVDVDPDAKKKVDEPEEVVLSDADVQELVSDFNKRLKKYRNAKDKEKQYGKIQKEIEGLDPEVRERMKGMPGYDDLINYLPEVDNMSTSATPNRQVEPANLDEFGVDTNVNASYSATMIDIINNLGTRFIEPGAISIDYTKGTGGKMGKPGGVKQAYHVAGRDDILIVAVQPDKMSGSLTDVTPLEAELNKLLAAKEKGIPDHYLALPEGITIIEVDGQPVPALVMKKLAGGSKDIYDKGVVKTGDDSLAKQGALTTDTVRQLREIRQLLIDSDTHITDFQFLFDKDGNVFLNDMEDVRNKAYDPDDSKRHDIAYLDKFIEIAEEAARKNSGLTALLEHNLIEPNLPKDDLSNHTVPLTPNDGLQSSIDTPFSNVVTGAYGTDGGRYLWTVDERGINIALENTSWDQAPANGKLKHTNLSPTGAVVAGEVWFIDNKTVAINAESGRYNQGHADNKRPTNSEGAYLDAAEIWEKMGYKVIVHEFGDKNTEYITLGDDE